MELSEKEIPETIEEVTIKHLREKILEMDEKIKSLEKRTVELESMLVGKELT